VFTSWWLRPADEQLSAGASDHYAQICDFGVKGNNNGEDIEEGHSGQ
jgi:hypothetical protein